jgi:hypothetical protein
MIWFWGSVGLHLSVGFPYLLSGLLAPLWAVGILMVIWGALAVLLVRTKSQGPRDLWAPLLAAAIWLTVMGVREPLFGWTA